jgi:hypothetical protein
MFQNTFSKPINWRMRKVNGKVQPITGHEGPDGGLEV